MQLLENRSFFFKFWVFSSSFDVPVFEFWKFFWFWDSSWNSSKFEKKFKTRKEKYIFDNHHLLWIFFEFWLIFLQVLGFFFNFWMNFGEFWDFFRVLKLFFRVLKLFFEFWASNLEEKLFSKLASTRLLLVFPGHLKIWTVVKWSIIFGNNLQDLALMMQSGAGT